MVLVDTSAWIEVFHRPPRLVIEDVVEFDEIVTCLPVVQEVLQGFNSEDAFRIGRDAMLVRRNSTLEVVANGFRLVTGAVLTVFSPGRSRQLTTPTATIGIRGTAVYLEAQRGRTYACTCYGEAELGSAFDPAARET